MDVRYIQYPYFNTEKNIMVHYLLIINFLSLLTVRAFISNPLLLSAPIQSALGSSRRTFFSGVVVVGECIALSGGEPAFAINDQASSSKLPTGLLESRLESNVLEPPPYGMESSDIFYPSWFAGNWKVASETKRVEAPCGVPLFGGNATFNNAQNDIGNVLKYECRFLNDDQSRVIADREFNVKSIVKVSMGENSIVDISVATPNKFSCILAPKGSPSLLSVDLIVLNRRSEKEEEDPNNFYCSEVVREIATIVGEQRQQQKRPSVLKEIETTSKYTYLPERDEVHCIQRSASFLLPSDQNEMAMRMWQLSRGRAIDVRFYDVVYTRPLKVTLDTI